MGSIPISAEVHRRQNRITLLCVIFAAFMITAVFNMVEMGVRIEQARLAEKHDGFSISVLFNSTMGQTPLLSTGIILLLILFAGVLTISSNLNSSVAQRTKSFGMIRCIGMNKEQIVRFVCLEALDRCKTVVPIGLVFDISAPWILCGVLWYAVGEGFFNISLFGTSVIGTVSDIIVGVIMVLLATGSPANQAARVSPATAISGNSEHGKMKNHTFHAHFIKVETAPGIHHATSMKKDLLLVADSFALSIVLSLSLTALIDLINHLMPQSVVALDIDILSSDGLSSIDSALAETLQGMSGVKQVYGRRGNFDIPVERDIRIAVSSAVGLVFLDDFDLNCPKKDGALRQDSNLSKVYGNNNHALATRGKGSSQKIGDKILIRGEEIEITGLLKYDPFSSSDFTNGKITLVTSDQTFTRLTGVAGYSPIMVQTASQATDEDVSQLCNTVTESGSHFNDKRDQCTSGTCLAPVFCIYCFLGIITLVTILNITSGISMSVLAKIKRHGVMWVVGMDEQQITKMIFMETLTHAFWGGGISRATGLPFSKVLYDFLISDCFPYAVRGLSAYSLVIILLFVVLVATLTAYTPARRIRGTSVAETINEP